MVCVTEPGFDLKSHVDLPLLLLRSLQLVGMDIPSLGAKGGSFPGSSKISALSSLSEQATHFAHHVRLFLTVDGGRGSPYETLVGKIRC